MQPTVVITRRGEDRARGGHPWIYRSDIAEVRASRGDTVQVVGPHGRPVGQALFSDRSEIALRFLTHGDEPADLALWDRRLRAAVAFRESLHIDASAYRLVHGEADLLPSLIVDRYGSVLVVQALSQGVDRLLPQITSLLKEILQPSGILARNDPRVRLLEGLERKIEVLHGEVPEAIVVREGSIEYDVDPWKGQKTGLFLDQRENHEAASVYARGRALDCFTYQGGFALRLASKADDVMAVDISDDALGRVGRNAHRNHLANVRTVSGNVFDVLRELERASERFDAIVLDPPAFAKNRAALSRALAGYKEINLRALKLLVPDGYLITCSCSYHVDESRLGQVLHEAATDARVSITVVEKRMQSRDHPVLLAAPETHYLKCFIARKIV